MAVVKKFEYLQTIRFVAVKSPHNVNKILLQIDTGYESIIGVTYLLINDEFMTVKMINIFTKNLDHKARHNSVLKNLQTVVALVCLGVPHLSILYYSLRTIHW